jgi:hypothetical protein
MDGHKEAPQEQELPEMRNAFSVTTVEAREHYVEEQIRQIKENNHGSPSSADMKRATSVRHHLSALFIVTFELFSKHFLYLSL